MKIVGPPDGSGGGVIRISPPDGTRAQEVVRDITIVVAMSRENCIGRGGVIPWRISADMAHFKNVTMGDFKTSGKKNIVVMGRKTFESIPDRFRPLPDRINIVLSRYPMHIPFRDCDVVNSEKRVMAMARHRKVFIAGGAEIYRLFLPLVNRLIVSHIDIFIKNGDAFFPEIGKEWCVVNSIHHPASIEKSTPSFTIKTYSRLPRP